MFTFHKTFLPPALYAIKFEPDFLKVKLTPLFFIYIPGIILKKWHDGVTLTNGTLSLNCSLVKNHFIINTGYSQGCFYTQLPINSFLFLAETVNIFLLLETRSPRSRCWQGWFLLRPLSLACSWPPSYCGLTWPFLWAPESLCVLSAYKDTSHIG